MRSDMLKGHLDLLILAVVADGPVHGYAVIEELRRRSGSEFDLPEGTVYPVLHRLERDGLLESSWGTADNGRRRRSYRITAAGRRRLESGRIEWDAFARALGSVIGRGPWPATR